MINICMIVKSFRIRNKESPEGDGKAQVKFLYRVAHLIRNKESPEGDGK